MARCARNTLLSHQEHRACALGFTRWILGEGASHPWKRFPPFLLMSQCPGLSSRASVLHGDGRGDNRRCLEVRHAEEGLACISLSSSRLAVTLVSLLPSLSLAMSRCGSPEGTCVWQSHDPVCGDSWVLHSAGHCPIPIARGTAGLCVCVIHRESGAGLVVGTHRARSERHFWNDACVTRASTVRLCLPQRLCHLRGSVQPWGM